MTNACNIKTWGKKYLPGAINKPAFYTCKTDKILVYSRQDDQPLPEEFQSHRDGYGDNDVKGLTMKASLVKFIPKNLDQIFRNLRALKLSRTGLIEINKSDLKPLPQLTDLWIKHNELEELPHDLFTYSRKLERISFFGNKIQYIGKSLLKPLESLKFIDFRKNVNIDLQWYSNDQIDPDDPLFNGLRCGLHLHELEQVITDNCQHPPLDTTLSGTYVFDLWLHSNFSDFVIKVKQKTFKVHKNILAVNSPVFNAMLTHETQEKLNSELIVPDISPEAIYELLKFIYLREVPIEPTNAMDLYAAAEKYQIQDLILISESLVLKGLTNENAMEVYMLADHHNNDFMKLFAFKAVQKNFFEETVLADFISNEIFVIPDGFLDRADSVQSLSAAKSEMKEKIREACNEMKMRIRAEGGVGAKIKTEVDENGKN